MQRISRLDYATAVVALRTLEQLIIETGDTRTAAA